MWKEFTIEAIQGNVVSTLLGQVSDMGTVKDEP
jgi:hypothetical protein